MNINVEEIKSQALSLFEKIKSDKKILAGVIAGAVLFVIAICVSLGSSSKLNTPQEQFKAVLIGVSKNQNGFLDKIVNSFSVNDKKKALIREHYKKMFDEELVDFYIKKLDENGVFNAKKLDKSKVFQQAFKIVNGISVEGILKTSKKDIEAFFNYNKLLVNSLSPNTCKMYVIGDARLFGQKEMHTSSQKIFKKMTESELDAYLLAQRNASHAVAKGVPSNTLTKEQVLRAEKLIEEANSREIEKLSPIKRKRIVNGANNALKANPVDVCEFGKFVYKSVDSIKNETDRELVIAHLLGSQQ